MVRSGGCWPFLWVRPADEPTGSAALKSILRVRMLMRTTFLQAGVTTASEGLNDEERCPWPSRSVVAARFGLVWELPDRADRLAALLETGPAGLDGRAVFPSELKTAPILDNLMHA